MLNPYEDIIFENQTNEDTSQIEKIKKLLPQSKIIMIKECNQYALRQYGCIDDYTIVYVYNNKPILIDQKQFNFIRAYISNGTEKTSTYITKTRMYITHWEKSKFIGKKVNLSQEGKSKSTPYLYKYEIENMIKQKF
ncbi:hypothetical protein CHRY9390_02359 [Chryseobacterium aquaeductus]|uniref:Uncharacterized protein n=1 Tax=Chryseobacterium aquaeductus TaxID=2675056 RepID=A0A9N8QR45_9FLAO|nr:hypothetical protein [Chryseobacterium aquaeductus]CAA7331646.1 hypothetical protein CHRY9390_02359 [Chryseobacterium potabilaquae]CAD7811455.1 hypothetical protein CHRY9390_02359 [Chryseobacterium aquaeductus]